MSHAELESLINDAFEDRDNVGLDTQGPVRDGVNEALNLLDSGQARVAEKRGDEWVVNQWLKKAVLLSFRLNDMATDRAAAPAARDWWDKVPSKFLKAGMRCRVPRRGLSRRAAAAWCAIRPISRRA